MADDKATPTSTTATDEIDEQKLAKVSGGNSKRGILEVAESPEVEAPVASSDAKRR